MNNLRKILCCLLMSVLTLTVFASCGNTKKDWLYSCNPDNILAFEGYYYKDGRLNIVFDTSYIKKDNEPSGFYGIKKDQEWPHYGHITVGIEDADRYKPDTDDIDIDVTGGKMIISFEMDKDDAKNITGFAFNVGNTMGIDLEKGTLYYRESGGDCDSYWRQEYDSKRDKWGKVDYEFNLYEQSVVE